MNSIKTLTRYALYTLLCAVFLTGCRQQGWNVEAGQIWIKEYNIGNPYEQVERDTVIILEVCGDFVKFKRNGKIQSDNKYWIPVNARLLK